MRLRVLVRLFLLLCVTLVVSAGAWAAQSGQVTEVKLDNGLTVLMKPVHAAPVFTAQVWFKVGSRNEYTGITGVSHLLEHMLFNTSKYYKKGEITKMVRERGGIDNAATWTDFTYYWDLLSSEHLDFALKTLAEKMRNALLLPAELENERTVVLSEREGRENDPDSVLYEALMATAFVAHPYQWPVIGWKSDVRDMPRERMVAYYNTYYHPGNATVVLVGDFDPTKALALVKKHFGAIPARGKPAGPYTVEPPQRGEKSVTIRMQGSAERVLLGYHVPDLENPDTYPLVVLDQILSGGRSSRLYQALVDKQIASSAWSSAGARKDPSLFIIGATGMQGVTSADLEKALLEQVEAAKNAPPTAEEIQAAKNQLEAYFIFQNDSVSDQGEQLGYYSTVASSWKYLDKLVERIKAVSPKQVQEVARKYFTRDNMTVARFIPTGPDGEAAPGGQGAGPIHKYESSPAKEFRVQSSEFRVSSCFGSSRLAQAQQFGLNPTTEAAGKPGTTTVRPARAVLDNGLVVIVQENKANPTVAIAAALDAGSCFDSAGKTGTAGLVAETVTRGTKTRTALQIAQEVEFVGASLSGSAQVESARFSAKSLSRDFPRILDLLADELRNATFPQEDFEKAKGEAISGLEESKESTDAQAMRAFYGTVYPPGHPYYQPGFAEAHKELDTITRDDLAAFYARYYRPDAAIITITGDVDAKQVVALIKEKFGDWSAQGPAPKCEIPTIQPQKEPKREAIDLPDKSEVSVVFGYTNTLRRADPEYYAFRVMNQILGGAGALASILGEDIREKQGLVYDVYSTFDAGRGAGPWYAALGTNPKNVDKAIESLQTEISRFKEKGATKDQFSRSLEFIIGVFPIALETNAGVANALLNAEFYGLGMDYLRNYASIYRKVTLDQVNAAARKYLHPDAATLVIAGPYEAK